MRKIFLPFIVLFLVATFFLPAPLSARGSRNKAQFTTLEKIEQLADISQDLDPAITTIYLKPGDDCFCSCREAAWSCTSIECNVHNKQCGSIPDPRQAQTRQDLGRTIYY